MIFQSISLDSPKSAAGMISSDSDGVAEILFREGGWHSRMKTYWPVQCLVLVAQLELVLASICHPFFLKWHGAENI